MKINHNMSAVITNHQLLNNENSLSVSMEKLSSGLRINHAKDDAAGMAISTKMRAQIQGLNQASRNASDGNSILQTADGALNEVTSMIQRMRELAVQAANETNTDDDKDSIQDEIESLKKEKVLFGQYNLLCKNQKLTVYPPIQSLIQRHYLTEVSIPECMGIMFQEFPYQMP